MTNGSILIGSGEATSDKSFVAFDPSKNEALESHYAEADATHVDKACALAKSASEVFSETSPEDRAQFLETCAKEIEAIGDILIETAMQETGLPRPRLEGERGRTCGQLRLFAQEVRQGYWLEATIDPAMPDRQPLPRPDLRRRNVAIGPVAVFGASNFPLAFSVAGGDTASAFAAGCPVVVKGHPAHPGTGELVARAIQKAVKQCALAEGVFSYLPGTSNDLGAALVSDPRIAAVGFTGSRAGGLALSRIAQQRHEPIPVYAEMSAVNPVVILPGALKGNAAGLAKGFATSLTMGAGQFCTNPGVVIAIAGAELDEFVDTAVGALGEIPAPVMLTSGINKAYCDGVQRLEAKDGIALAGRGTPAEGNACQSALFRTDAESFLKDDDLAAEVFGSSSVVVSCADESEMARVLEAMEGQLTVTIHMVEDDHDLAGKLVPILQEKAGRVLANGWPTGVEVCHAMVHGGPYPATTDSRTTSVGTLAMKRFLRPVCYQDLPDALLPDALKSDNPLSIPRRVDGTWG
ncbi:aldehyde dehydrogenase family protein [Porphyrobacter algicida]|uniref:Aldehyde dehydrogenase family protein n=1 Tax=Qipengyuania algicida TaxID=1836209 RepID=A0A845ACP5_9SPHN|nr:aldehyde dehydrogenase family protein [Qipengyuania algicida]